MRVLSYCLGSGTIALRGSKKRPWLDLQRSETEQTYARHQIRTLHRLHPGELEVVWDQVERNGFYNDVRCRVQSDLLRPAYELMYPRDEKVVTPEIIRITGFGGIVALFSDRGCVKGKRIILPIKHGNAWDFAHYLKELGYRPKVARSETGTDNVHFEGLPGLQFAKDVRRLTHPSLHGKVEEFIDKYEPKSPPVRARCQ